MKLIELNDPNEYVRRETVTGLAAVLTAMIKEDKIIPDWLLTNFAEKLNDPNIIKVAHIAPSVRAAIGEAFSLPIGTLKEGDNK